MKNINEYDAQAMNFLTKTATKFKAVFIKFDKHFDTDTEKRNIFKITLSNKNGEYTFNFGSSIVDSCQKRPEIESKNSHEVYCGIAIGNGESVDFLSIEFDATNEELYNESLSMEKMAKLTKQWDDKAEEIKKKRESNYITVSTPPFRKVCPEALRKARIRLFSRKVYVNVQQEEINYPTSYDVLACLTSYDPESFDNFCSEYGYDTDSRNAEKTYKAVQKEYDNLSILFNANEMELLGEIQ